MTEADPADERYFVITEEQWITLWEMLDSAIARDLPKLRELMAKEPIWAIPEEELPSE